MSKTVAVDKKGRLVLPKRVREEARINVNTKLVAKARGVGRVELVDPDILMSKAQEIGAKKLTGWKEDEHEATAHLLRSLKEKNETR